MRNNKTKKNKPDRTQKNKYTRREYNSNDGMLTQVWGAPLWHFLHTMSFNYPVSPTSVQKKQYKEHLLSLQHVLPCKKCRDNLAENFKENPITQKDLQDREAFSRYVYNLHNKINFKLGKRSGLTYEDVRDRYEHFRARCSDDSELGCNTPLKPGKKRCLLRIVDAKVHDCETLMIEP